MLFAFSTVTPMVDASVQVEAVVARVKLAGSAPNLLMDPRARGGIGSARRRSAGRSMVMLIELTTVPVTGNVPDAVSWALTTSGLRVLQRKNNP